VKRNFEIKTTGIPFLGAKPESGLVIWRNLLLVFYYYQQEKHFLFSLHSQVNTKLPQFTISTNKDSKVKVMKKMEREKWKKEEKEKGEGQGGGKQGE